MGFKVFSKNVKFNYFAKFNLFGGPIFETTTESSKIVGPGMCQTRAMVKNVLAGFLRNIFCSDLSLIRCGHDYVILMIYLS